MTDIADRTREWIAGDPDPQTRDELSGILQSGDPEDLADRMNGTLTFGTAGIRGAVEAGSNRMNRATVIRTTAGLAEYLRSITEPKDRLVVIGRDARPSSQAFMEDTIAVLTAAGFDIRYFPDPTPTPLVAYAGLTMGACASIVITASHNPPADNGYKVYAASGVQIISPTDSDIAERINQIGRANEVPRTARPFDTPAAKAMPDDLFDDYLRDVGQALPGIAGDRSLSIVYTAMHGVGGWFVTEALRRFGFHRVNPVARQFAPDGTFPTVSFPNPEEPGALDLAHELAEALDADLVLANDPDTDRLAVSVPEPGGAWRPLSGNQIGCLLAEFLLASRDNDVEGGFVVNSVVSSPLLAKVADRHGVISTQTLTGFKWIWNAALDLGSEGHGSLVLGYEEALGYSVGSIVRDKDGISAALAFGIMAAVAAAREKTVLDLVGEMYEKYGVWVSAQVSIRIDTPDGPDEIKAMMDALRSEPPATVGGHTIDTVTDFLEGADDRPRYLGATNLMQLDLGSVGRVLARPSGTEPKLKIYVDLTTDFPESGDWIGAEAALLRDAVAVGNDLADWLKASIEG